MIVHRGYPRPPSLHIPRLRQAPLGHFFMVISDGYGAMPGYGYLITPHERWAIAAYIRALQLSQYAPVAELPEAHAAALTGLRSKLMTSTGNATTRSAASATPGCAGGCGGSGAVRAGAVRATGAIFSLVSDGLSVLAWGGPGLPGHSHAASPGGWDVGHGDPTGAGGGDAPVTPHAAAVLCHWCLVSPISIPGPVLQVRETHGASQFRQVYLSVPFFLGRAACYFAVWLLLAFFLNRWSRQQEQASGSSPSSGDVDAAWGC